MAETASKVPDGRNPRLACPGHGGKIPHPGRCASRPVPEKQRNSNKMIRSANKGGIRKEREHALVNYRLEQKVSKNLIRPTPRGRHD